MRFHSVASDCSSLWISMHNSIFSKSQTIQMIVTIFRIDSNDTMNLHSVMTTGKFYYLYTLLHILFFMFVE